MNQGIQMGMMNQLAMDLQSYGLDRFFTPIPPMSIDHARDMIYCYDIFLDHRGDSPTVLVATNRGDVQAYFWN